MSMEFETEDAASLLKPHEGLHLMDRTLIITGVPKDDGAIGDIDEDIKWFIKGLHGKFRDRIKNLSVTWE